MGSLTNFVTDIIEIHFDILQEISDDLVELGHTLHLDQIEAFLLANDALPQGDKSNAVYNLLMESSNYVLAQHGIRLNEDECPRIDIVKGLLSVITFLNIDAARAEWLEILNDDSLGAEDTIATIVDEFFDVDSHDVNMALERVEPALIDRIVEAIDTRVYEMDITIDAQLRERIMARYQLAVGLYGTDNLTVVQNYLDKGGALGVDGEANINLLDAAIYELPFTQMIGNVIGFFLLSGKSIDEIKIALNRILRTIENPMEQSNAMGMVGKLKSLEG